MLQLQDYLAGMPTAVWAALSGAVSGLATWFVGMRNISVSVEGARIRLAAEAAAGESADRAAFRVTLMAEISDLRLMIKECDAERDVLRGRINATEGQILVLKASNEIMERWVRFFKDRDALDLSNYPFSGKQDAKT